MILWFNHSAILISNDEDWKLWSQHLCLVAFVWNIKGNQGKGWFFFISLPPIPILSLQITPHKEPFLACMFYRTGILLLCVCTGAGSLGLVLNWDFWMLLIIHNKQHYTLPILTTVYQHLERRVKTVPLSPSWWDYCSSLIYLLPQRKLILLESREKCHWYLWWAVDIFGFVVFP